MSDRERQRAAHLMLLIILTGMSVILAVESVLLGWNMEAVMLLLIGVIVSWAVYVTEQLSAQNRLWLYVILSMLAFFFYGVHETSIYDLAPVMIMYMVVCIVIEKMSVVRFGLLTYLVTMGYDLLFVVRDHWEWDVLNVSRTALHIVLVCLSDYLVRIILQWRARERKKAEETIRLHEQINERTENFLANVSHELRTPINAVTGITSVMLKKHTDVETRDQLLAVQQAGNRLFGQIEDILDYTEIDTGRICVSNEPYMMTSIVNDLIMGRAHLSGEHEPELVLDIDARIPAVLEGDGRKIKKIVRHLVGNAVKFTHRGGVYVRIYTREKEYGVNLCIQVSDTGEGIAPEHMAQITERFFQSSEGRNRKAGGLGLGLSIVYGMVAAMDGFVQIQSKPEEGTTVFVSIPQKVMDVAPGMMLENREELCLGCYLSPKKYEVPTVRGYYDDLISHLVCGLDVKLHRVSDEKELKRLVEVYQLTHLIIGQEEYEKAPDYFESLDRNICVIVIAGGTFDLPQGSRMIVLKKPFYGLPLVTILNTHSAKHVERGQDQRMVCPHTKVLVVDDEPMNLMVAQGILGGYQMQVTTARSGFEAIEICEKEDFDLLFLDHMMPGLDGVETLHRIRKLHAANGRDVTAVAFTANAVSGAREMFAREGFDEFVSKPIETQELERVLRKLVPVNQIEYISAEQDADAPSDGQPTAEDDFIVVPAASGDWVDELEAQGIHTSQALQYCMSDVSFYRQILERFCIEYPPKEQTLRTAYETEDTANYRISMHALKSSAKMIGADALSEQARKLEDAAKKSDLAYMSQFHDACMQSYTDTARMFAEVLGIQLAASEHVQEQSTEPAEAVQGQSGMTELSGAQLQEKLSELHSYLDTYEAERAETLMDEIAGAAYGGTPVGTLLSEIRRDVGDFEMGAAAKKLQALQTQLEGGES